MQHANTMTPSWVFPLTLNHVDLVKVHRSLETTYPIHAACQHNDTLMSFSKKKNLQLPHLLTTSLYPLRDEWTPINRPIEYPLKIINILKKTRFNWFAKNFTPTPSHKTIQNTPYPRKKKTSKPPPQPKPPSPFAPKKTPRVPGHNRWSLELLHEVHPLSAQRPLEVPPQRRAGFRAEAALQGGGGGGGVPVSAGKKKKQEKQKT